MMKFVSRQLTCSVNKTNKRMIPSYKASLREERKSFVILLFLVIFFMRNYLSTIIIRRTILFAFSYCYLIVWKFILLSFGCMIFCLHLSNRGIKTFFSFYWSIGLEINCLFVSFSWRMLTLRLWWWYLYEWSRCSSMYLSNGTCRKSLSR